MAADKTWAQLQDAIEETFRKRGMDAPQITCTLPKRSAAKRYQSIEERTVSISWREWIGIGRGGHAPITLTVKRGDRAMVLFRSEASASMFIGRCISSLWVR